MKSFYCVAFLIFLLNSCITTNQRNSSPAKPTSLSPEHVVDFVLSSGESDYSTMLEQMRNQLGITDPYPVIMEYLKAHPKKHEGWLALGKLASHADGEYTMVIDGKLRDLYTSNKAFFQSSHSSRSSIKHGGFHTPEEFLQYLRATHTFIS